MEKHPGCQAAARPICLPGKTHLRCVGMLRQRATGMPGVLCSATEQGIPCGAQCKGGGGYSCLRGAGGRRVHRPQVGGEEAIGVGQRVKGGPHKVACGQCVVWR